MLQGFNIGLLTLCFFFYQCNGSKTISSNEGESVSLASLKETPKKQDASIKSGGRSAQTTFIYPWLDSAEMENQLVNRFETPEATFRISLEPNSFANWLRHLPLKEGVPKVHLYNGELKSNQDAHCAVIDLDVGKKDLQQCADACMRLRAEYLRSVSRANDIAFNFTSGDKASYSEWKNGMRPVISGNSVSWKKSAPESSSDSSFKDYLETVFTYAGTLSLSKELKKVESIKEIRVGDLLLQGGSPGHAVIVVDMIQYNNSNQKAFLLAQSYMPAQEMHILNNPETPDSPWYPISFGSEIITPEWTFTRDDVYRFE